MHLALTCGLFSRTPSLLPPPAPTLSFPSLPLLQGTLNARVLELTAEVAAAADASSALQETLNNVTKEKEDTLAQQARLLDERAGAAEEARLAARREAEEQSTAAAEAAAAAEEAAESLRRDKVGGDIVRCGVEPAVAWLRCNTPSKDRRYKRL